MSILAYRLRRMPSAALVAMACLLAAAPCSSASRAPEDFFAIVDGAPLVAGASIRGRRENAALGIVFFEVAVGQEIKGTAPPRLVVVQEMVFASDRPLFDRGQEWLLALEPLPPSSRYSALPQGETYYRVRQGVHGVRRVDAIPFVQRYTAAVHEVPAQQRGARIVSLVAALASDDVGDDVVRALAAEPSLAKDLSGAGAEHFAATMSDRHLPLERRLALLELVEAKRLSRFLSAVRPLLDDPEIAPFARRLLASFGEVPAAEHLRADLQRADPAARHAAVEAAQALPHDERLLLLAQVAAEDDEIEVRIAAIDALARGGRAAVPELAALLDDDDGRITYKAARGLAAAGGKEAVEALSGTFAGTNYDAQVAAVFALREIGSEGAMRALRELRESAPDPRLEKVIDVALGSGQHHH